MPYSNIYKTERTLQNHSCNMCSDMLMCHVHRILFVCKYLHRTKHNHISPELPTHTAQELIFYLSLKSRHENLALVVTSSYTVRPAASFPPSLPLHLYVTHPLSCLLLRLNSFSMTRINTQETLQCSIVPTPETSSQLQQRSSYTSLYV